MPQSVISATNEVVTWLLSPGGFIVLIVAAVMWVFARPRRPRPPNPDDMDS